MFGEWNYQSTALKTGVVLEIGTKVWLWRSKRVLCMTSHPNLTKFWPLSLLHPQSKQQATYTVYTANSVYDHPPSATNPSLRVVFLSPDWFCHRLTCISIKQPLLADHPPYYELRPDDWDPPEGLPLQYDHLAKIRPKWHSFPYVLTRATALFGQQLARADKTGGRAGCARPTFDPTMCVSPFDPSIL